METSEFSRMVDPRAIDSRPHRLAANNDERAALAKRFGLVSVDRLEAEIALARDGDAVDASGWFEAEIVQSCAVTGDDLPASIREDISLRFVPESAAKPIEGEIELEEEDLDEIAFSGDRFDLGEAVAQSLALAIDPYAVGPNADAARKEAGLLEEGDAGPFAALKGLVKE